MDEREEQGPDPVEALFYAARNLWQQLHGNRYGPSVLFVDELEEALKDAKPDAMPPHWTPETPGTPDKPRCMACGQEATHGISSLSKDGLVTEWMCIPDIGAVLASQLVGLGPRVTHVYTVGSVPFGGWSGTEAVALLYANRGTVPATLPANVVPEPVQEPTRDLLASFYPCKSPQVHDEHDIWVLRDGRRYCRRCYLAHYEFYTNGKEGEPLWLKTAK